MDDNHIPDGLQTLRLFVLGSDGQPPAYARTKLNAPTAVQHPELDRDDDTTIQYEDEIIPQVTTRKGVRTPLSAPPTPPGCVVIPTAALYRGAPLPPASSTRPPRPLPATPVHNQQIPPRQAFIQHIQRIREHLDQLPVLFDQAVRQGGGKKVSEYETTLRQLAIQKATCIAAGAVSTAQIQTALKKTQTCLALNRANTDRQALECFTAALKRVHFSTEAAALERRLSAPCPPDGTAVSHGHAQADTTSP
eukprot:4695986-Amphidinium_carterae.1